MGCAMKRKGKGQKADDLTLRSGGFSSGVVAREEEDWQSSGACAANGTCVSNPVSVPGPEHKKELPQYDKLRSEKGTL